MPAGEDQMAQPADEGPFAAGAHGGGAAATYSIKREFAGATVMITGAAARAPGTLLPLLIESLLRTTDVGKVYVLIRGKRGMSARERLARLLQSGLFHLVRDSPRLLAKVRRAAPRSRRAVPALPAPARAAAADACRAARAARLRRQVELLEGDMNSDGLGLSAADLAKVQGGVQFVVHSAASIELEADVQHTLRSNYIGTRRLLALARTMTRLVSFVHVSTAYVNVNHPRGAAVDEVIYPLTVGLQEVSHADVVDDLMSLERQPANIRAQMYLDMWGFPNTYTMGKNLSEKLVASYAADHGLPIAIVRPALVTGLAGAPYPGYCGNLAGPVGMGVAMAVGLFDRLESVAMVPTHVWDAVPGDVVCSAILATAAATAARVAVNQYANARPGDPLVVHAGTSTTYPISFAEAFHAGLDFVRDNPPPFRLPGGGLFTLPMDYRPSEAAVKRCKYWTSWKVWAAVRVLEALGQHKTARRLKYGHLAWEIQNSTKTDRNMFFHSRNLLALEAALDAGDAGSGHYTVTWTIRNGGWLRYIHTNIAGMYRIVFGMSNLKGLEDSEFRFIPSRSVLPVQRSASAAAAAAADEDDDADAAHGDAALAAGIHRAAAAFARIPAAGSLHAALADDALPPAGAPAGEAPPRYAGAPPPDNARGLGMSLSSRLGQSLSYRPAAMADVASGAGAPQRTLSRLLSKPLDSLTRLPTPAGSLRNDDASQDCVDPPPWRARVRRAAVEQLLALMVGVWRLCKEQAEPDSGLLKLLTGAISSASNGEMLTDEAVGIAAAALLGEPVMVVRHADERVTAAVHFPPNAMPSPAEVAATREVTAPCALWVEREHFSVLQAQTGSGARVFGPSACSATPSPGPRGAPRAARAGPAPRAAPAPGAGRSSCPRPPRRAVAARAGGDSLRRPRRDGSAGSPGSAGRAGGSSSAAGRSAGSAAGGAAVHFDFLVLGSGIAGLSYALKVAEYGSVAVITKDYAGEGCTQYAQGGVCAVLDASDSVEAHVEDTIVAGAFLNDRNAVEVVCREGPARVLELVKLGADFTRNADGSLHLTREGGHSNRRIVHAADLTGAEIERALLATARRHPRITFHEHHLATELVVDEVGGAPHCLGADVLDQASGTAVRFLGLATMLATGGAGQVYPSTTNPHVATGDGMAMAYRAGAAMANMEFVQFHPTALYAPPEAGGRAGAERTFLITEALRGEGGRLTNLDGERFMAGYDDRLELAPRDVVARAITDQMQSRREPHVLLDISHKPRSEVLAHFPNIAKRCAAAGIDIAAEPIPVLPAQHYMCGGVVAGLRGETSVQGLFACGEVSCSGLHGANRLASNSLLEGLVFADRAAGPAVAHAEYAARACAPHLRAAAAAADFSGARAPRPLPAAAAAWVAAKRGEVRRLMWEAAGIVRRTAALQAAQAELAAAYVEVKSLASSCGVSTPLVELLNLVTVAELIVSCALQRRESRGLHFSADFPAPAPGAPAPSVIAASIRARYDLDALAARRAGGAGGAGGGLASLLTPAAGGAGAGAGAPGSPRGAGAKKSLLRDLSVRSLPESAQ
ncbi:L-aspartate oxidase [Scenedesmus sp. PABB004]|nr:L-aspartate oxidase [Scenedesmus sp. PABB004]